MHVADSGPQRCSHCAITLHSLTHTHIHLDRATDQPKVLIFENDRQRMTVVIIQYAYSL